ncbi:RpiR family transcriptional regulator [Mesorhizobium sp. MSK_1335]|uniref:RpiR family transcriptional regulator n=1 Tax=Mesorhizobium montanum TaxID=3072323 RepID=A0ABU4ZPV2_9HYPH|nr:RpiR family transcriptional regulator [Mesorhizobium sp. MSK_1335]MDX8527408.1 RpiR family transcriptional regulator [Mesorhizobium sp. MSK_1335]
MSVSDHGTNRAATFADLKRGIACRELVFPPQVEKLAAVAFAHPELLAFDSAVKIAASTGVSKTTVARFARLLGKRSLKEARNVFREELQRRHEADAGRAGP